MDVIPGDGTVPVAYTSVSDVGVYVAKIVADPRTLNKKVFAYTEVLTGNQVAELMDEVSGEKSKRNYVCHIPYSVKLRSPIKLEANMRTTKAAGRRYSE